MTLRDIGGPQFQATTCFNRCVRKGWKRTLTMKATTAPGPDCEEEAGSSMSASHPLRTFAVIAVKLGDECPLWVESGHKGWRLVHSC
jgi:hypothetical protein